MGVILTILVVASNATAPIALVNVKLPLIVLDIISLLKVPEITVLHATTVDPSDGLMALTANFIGTPLEPSQPLIRLAKTSSREKEPHLDTKKEGQVIIEN